jgi:hypothetical protein
MSSSLAKVGALFMVGLLASNAQIARADDAPLPTFPLSIAVAEEDGRPVADESWVLAQVDQANALFTPHGVDFRRSSARTLAHELAHVETRSDRDALGDQVEAGAINVFVVASLRDVDEPDRYRRGVCWQSTRNGKKRFLILSVISRPTVLAHELGHFFGNPHSTVVDNVMSYDHRTDSIFFDDAQGRRIRWFATKYIATKTIDPWLAATRRFP